MKNIEKLAREICWMGFTTREGRLGKTKASYWKSLSDEKRKEYIRDAEWWHWVYCTVPVEMAASDYLKSK